MLDLNRLRVSLTKNGYMKIADVLKRHPRWEVLDNLSGTYPGVKLIRSQAANIMGEDGSGEVPEFWDEIRSHSDKAIDSFMFFAIVMSHADLIELLKSSCQGDMKGYIQRGQLGEKAYTNLIFAMASVGICDYVRGAEAVSYDMRGVVYELREAGHIVRELIESKLRKCGWKDTSRPGGTEFFKECKSNDMHLVFGLGPKQFRDWLGNQLEIKPPEERVAERLRISR